MYSDILIKFDTFLRRRVQDLCRGKEPGFTGKTRLKCLWLHQGHPFLKLGPFKLELLHAKPQIGVIHDFASEKETSQIIAKAKGTVANFA